MLVKVINLNDYIACLLLPLMVEVLLIEWGNISDGDHFARVVDARRPVNNFIFFKFLFHCIMRVFNRYLTGEILTDNIKHRR